MKKALGSIDFGGRARESLLRSQKRRAIAAKLRRRRLRVRGSTLSLLSVLLVTAVAGAGVSLADNPGAQAGAASSEVTLRKGDRGPAVAKVQRKLRITADGVFGSMTHRSVKRFQRRKGLTADGIVGPMTRRALRLGRFARSSVVHPRRRSRRRSSGGSTKLPAILVKIARCESGGDPRAVSSNGQYRGKYQFLRSTWKSWGGQTSDPIRASEAAQDKVALRLYRARGTSPWPSCG